MKSIFLALFVLASIFIISLNAEEINKSTIENDKKVENNSKNKLAELQERTKNAQQKSESLDKLEKTVSEINDKLGIKK